ncbi:hypothetical protein [Commensalibacter melissae]|uniref:hypothetical protein n=1 Tax=Commensalibacter melissae TaxID=2070537 RepID=UPI0012D90B25|nr:hypothetical protein [Commensalibacter melissae]MUG78307.1 hypothetical protein [Commensalibacter melissae]
MNKIKWQVLLTQTEELAKNFFILPFAQMIQEHDVFSHLGLCRNIIVDTVLKWTKRWILRS